MMDELPRLTGRFFEGGTAVFTIVMHRFYHDPSDSAIFRHLMRSLPPFIYILHAFWTDNCGEPRTAQSPNAAPSGPRVTQISLGAGKDTIIYWG